MPHRARGSWAPRKSRNLRTRRPLWNRSPWTLFLWSPVLRLKVTRRDGTRGDLLVSVDVVVPATLSAEARQALDSYAEVEGSPNPRAKLFAGGA